MVASREQEQVEEPVPLELVDNLPVPPREPCLDAVAVAFAWNAVAAFVPQAVQALAVHSSAAEPSEQLAAEVCTAAVEPLVAAAAAEPVAAVSLVAAAAALPVAEPPVAAEFSSSSNQSSSPIVAIVASKY